MIICSNCGATNNEESGKFCRKCGLLLPFSSKSQRIKINSTESIESQDLINSQSKNLGKKEKRQKKNNITNMISPHTNFFVLKNRQEENEYNLDLQEIPKNISFEDPPKNQPLTKHKNISTNINGSSSESTSKPLNLPKVKPLKEVKPKPFGGSIITSKKVYGVKKAKKEQTINKIKKKNEKLENLTENVEIKRKRLEEDMLEVLGVLSNKLRTPKDETPGIIKQEITPSKVEHVPTNMNEILKNLLKFDLHIEASAILKENKILASATSSRISETLLATISQNLSMIGNDIIDGLSAGPLKSISLRGFNGVLDLAPIDSTDPSMRDLILIIFSHPKVKSGIISFAVNIVRNQLKELSVNNI